MRDSDPNDEKAALQIIILGSGGGPLEDNTTAFLIRSIEVGWRRGSVLAVDAGVHLAAIAKILEPFVDESQAQSRPDSRQSAFSVSSGAVTLTDGPFQGLELPYRTAGANAAHVTRDLIDTYLITHPHLDHISAFVVNTASLHSSRPKRIAGLPSTIAAFKQHIFNNVIWPNLSDENDGAGLVTYMRLIEGGSLALGEGESQGYIEITEGLGVKTWSVSHGHCMEHHSHRGSSADINPIHRGSFRASSSEMHSPRHDNHDHLAQLAQATHYESSPARTGYLPASHIFAQRFPPERMESDQRLYVYDSSAYFIRDLATGREALIFGDVEPDEFSLFPRNLQIWTEAAPKIASGLLKGILIECSYTDERLDTILFGHLCPRHLITELKVLASLVAAAKTVPRSISDPDIGRKRKRPSNGGLYSPQTGSSRRRSNRSSHSQSTHVSEPRRPGISRTTLGGVSPRSGPPSVTKTGMSTDQIDEPDPVDIGPPSRLVVPHRAASSDRLAAEGLINDNDQNNSEGTKGSSYRIPTQAALDTPSPLSQADGAPVDLQPTISAVGALRGLKVIIIHVKEKLEDEEPPGGIILQELLKHEEEAQLGCEFVISEPGMSVYL